MQGNDRAAARLVTWLRRERAAVGLLAVALVIRVVLVWHATWVPVSDSRDYHDFAFSMMRGEGYKQVYAGETPAFRGLTFWAYRMPGYPAFLAFVYSLFGRDPLAAFLANVACDLTTIVCLLALGRALLGRATAFVAASLFTIHLLWTPNLMTECLFTAQFTLLALLAVTHLRTPTRRLAIAFGVLHALAFFVRPIAVAALPLALYRTLRSHPWQRAVALSLLVLAPTVLAASLWSYRNHRILGGFVLSSNFGAHNARPFGVDFQSTTLAVRERGGNELDIDRALRRQILQSIRREPRAAWRVYARRVVDLLRLQPDWTLEAVLMKRTFTGPRGARWVQESYVALKKLYPVTYTLAFAGALILVARRRSLRGLWAIFAAYVLLHAVVSMSEIRFAAPLYPLLCLAAASALAQPGAWLHGRINARAPGAFPRGLTRARPRV